MMKLDKQWMGGLSDGHVPGEGRADRHTDQRQTELDCAIIRGTAAEKLLADADFRNQWTELYEACPWATVMQSLGFAQAWYTAYGPAVEPVLVLARDAGQRLVGLLALGLHGRRLVVAGAEQAEYQVWLATAQFGDAFAAAAMSAIRRRFPGCALTFRYLPPGTPLNWLAGGMGRHCLLTPFDRPLMRLTDDSAIKAVLKRRNIRSRLNKLKEAGFTGIERLSSVEQLDALFDPMIACHDLRRLAVSGTAPFADDTHKRAFHLEMMKHGVMCVTLLRTGEQPVSLQMDMIDPRKVHLALGAYAPWVSKLAPGKIHILEFAQLLHRQGCDYMDLTPGADPYKSEFATEWDQVHKLIVAPTFFAYQLARLQRWADGRVRALCRRWETEPVRLRMFVRELLRRPLATLLRPLRNRVRARYGVEVGGIFAIRSSRLAPLQEPRAADVKRNAITDLLAYRPVGLQPATHEFMSTAWQRLADGMDCYTVADDQRLRFSAWVTDQPEKVLSEAQCAELASLSRCAVIFDVVAHRREDGLLCETALAQMLHDVAHSTGAENLLIVMPPRQRALAERLERLGCVRLAEFLNPPVAAVDMSLAASVVSTLVSLSAPLSIL